MRYIPAASRRFLNVWHSGSACRQGSLRRGRVWRGRRRLVDATKRSRNRRENGPPDIKCTLRPCPDKLGAATGRPACRRTESGSRRRRRKEMQPMDLKAIRDHLYLAGLALGPEHPLSSRIKAVERNLTPGDPLWCNDAISAETDLLSISTELEHLPKVIPPRDG